MSVDFTDYNINSLARAIDIPQPTLRYVQRHFHMLDIYPHIGNSYRITHAEVDGLRRAVRIMREYNTTLYGAIKLQRQGFIPQSEKEFA